MNEADFTSAIAEGREISFSADASISDRTIEANWLERAFSANSGKICIENAVISGRLELLSVTISAHVAIRRCTLDGFALLYCTVNGLFSLNESIVAAMDLRGTVFARALWLRGTEIKGRLHLGYVSVGVELDLDETHVHGDIYAYAMSVAKNVHMRYATCEKRAEFSRLRADGQFDIKGTTFFDDFSMHDAELGAFSTEKTVFRKDAILERSRIHSSTFIAAREVATLNCHSLNVRGQFVIKDMAINGTTYFEAVECLDLCLIASTFAGQVSIIGAHVFALEIRDCKFRQEIKLNALRCDANVAFTDTDGTVVHFDAALISGTVGIGRQTRSEVTFQDLFFFGTRIGNQLILEGLRLNGLLVLESAKVLADLQFMDGLALGGISAMGAAVEGGCSFQGTLVGGPADFTNFSVGDQLIFVDAVFLAGVRFWSIKVGSHVDCRNALFECGAGFDRAAMPGQVILYDLLSAGLLSFRDATIGALFFDRRLTAEGSDSDFPFQYIDVDLSGCRYQQITVNWRNLVDALVLKQGKVLDRKPFLELERYFRSIGIDEWADAVYYTSRKTAGDRLPIGPAKIGNRIIRFVSGYGVRLHNVVRAVLLVLAALWLFLSFPGMARPTSVPASRYSCNATPDPLDRLGLAVAAILPGASKIVDGWAISDCPVRMGPYSVGPVRLGPLTFGQVRIGPMVSGPLRVVVFPLGKPYMFIAAGQLALLILLPFLVSTVTKSLRYGARES